jgi:hypothetical protein
VFLFNPINTNVSKNFTYRVEVRNGGTGAAKNGSVNISIPVGLSVYGATVSTGFSACTNTARLLSCKFATLAPNTTKAIVISLRTGAKPVRLISTVKVTASNDSNATNNIGKEAINVR